MTTTIDEPAIYYEDMPDRELEKWRDYYFDLHKQAHEANGVPPHKFDTWDDLMKHCMDELRQIDKALSQQ